MDDLNDALDNLAKNSRNAAGTRVSRDVTATQGGIAAGRDVYLGPPPRKSGPVRLWFNRWVMAPLATGAGVTIAIFAIWFAIEANRALDAGYSVAQVLLQSPGMTPGPEQLNTSIALGFPAGAVLAWVFALLKG